MDNLMKNLKRPAAMAALLMLTLAGCKSGQQQAPSSAAGETPSTPVTVAAVQTADMRKTVLVTGDLAALQDVTLSAKAVGRVDMVAAREGEPVRQGELLVHEWSQDLEANVQQAQANVVAAQAKLRQAYVNYKIGVVNADQGVINAKAALAQSRQNYLKTKRGSRPQEILEAQSTLDSAEASMKNAKLTLDRDQALFAQGAIAEQDRDQAQTTYDVDVAQYNNAEQALQLAQIGNREEDIAAAEAEVRQQDTSLKNAIVNRETVALRKDDIINAQATLDQMQGALSYADKQEDYASLTSPIDGIVASRSTEPGQIATAGTALMRIVNLKTVYYEPTVSETDIAGIQVGQTVGVQTDALPGKTFQGRVGAIFPAADTGERTFSLRVLVDNPDNVLRPGMFARGAIVTQLHRSVPVVPASALVDDAAGQGFTPNSSSDATVSTDQLVPPEHVVMVGSDGKAVIRHVTVGIANMDKAEITSGLEAGDKIVVIGQDSVHEGDPLSVVNDGAASGSQASQAHSSGA